MPELPEVETIAQELNAAHLHHATILDAHVYWERTIAEPSFALFTKKIKGQKLTKISRRGKYLTFLLSSGDSLLIHLRMTGRFQLVDSNVKPETFPHRRVVLWLDHGRMLVYSDPRKFGRWHLVKDSLEVLGKLGAEPLSAEFTPAFLQRLLHSKARQLKPLLLDQSCIAGLGNIYVDEALWRARLHPQRLSNTLEKDDVKHLRDAIQFVLERGLKAAGTTLGKGKSNFYRLSGERGEHQDHLDVFRHTGQPCPRCGTPIRRLVVGQRSTHICPNCQE